MWSTANTSSSNPLKIAPAETAYKLASADYTNMMNHAQGDESTIIRRARENIIKYAKIDPYKYGWMTAEFFLDKLKDDGFPLYKINLAGNNNMALMRTMAQQDFELQNKDISDFIVRLYSYCMDIRYDGLSLLRLSDEYFDQQQRAEATREAIEGLTISGDHSLYQAGVEATMIGDSEDMF